MENATIRVHCDNLDKASNVLVKVLRRLCGGAVAWYKGPRYKNKRSNRAPAAMKSLNFSYSLVLKDVSMTATVEGASIKYLDRLYEIEKECFVEEAFTKKQIAQLLTDYNSVSLIAKEDGRIVGFITGVIYPDKKAFNGHILTIDVSSLHRRKGIGEMLLQRMEAMFVQKGVQACILEVREDNVSALSLYRKLGYKEVGRLQNYYGKTHGIYLKKMLT